MDVIDIQYDVGPSLPEQRSHQTEGIPLDSGRIWSLHLLTEGVVSPAQRAAPAREHK